MFGGLHPTLNGHWVCYTHNATQWSVRPHLTPRQNAHPFALRNTTNIRVFAVQPTLVLLVLAGVNLPVN